MSTDKFDFRVSVETRNQTGEVLAVYFQVRKGKTKLTKEHAGGNVFADYDKRGKLLGIEMLAPCRASVLIYTAVAGRRQSDLFCLFLGACLRPVRPACVCPPRSARRREAARTSSLIRLSDRKPFLPPPRLVHLWGGAPGTVAFLPRNRRFATPCPCRRRRISTAPLAPRGMVIALQGERLRLV